MDQYIRADFNSQNIPKYNCSNFTAEEWTRRFGIKHPIEGYYSIILGTSALICYIPSLVAMMSHNLYKHSCYKIMVFLSICDICGISMSCIAYGYFMIHGYVFCTSPELMYLHGVFIIVFWCTQCATCWLLTINRLFEICSPKLSKLIFHGGRTYVTLLIPLGWMLIIFFWESPCVFNSVVQAEINDPLIFPNRTNEYNDFKQVFNNAFFCLGNAFMYFTLWILFHNKFADYFSESSGNKKDKLMFIQVTIISSLNITSGILYTTMLYFPVPELITIVAHATYQLIHCSPAFIYLLMNGSIRREIRKMLPCCDNYGRMSVQVNSNRNRGQQNSHYTSEKSSNYGQAESGDRSN